MSIQNYFLLHPPFEHFTPFPPIPNGSKVKPLAPICSSNMLDGDLLFSGFCQGFFAWNDPEETILWWSPATRCVIASDKIHISRSLRKTLRKMPYRITVDHDTMGVVEQCATVHGESWIDERMKNAIFELSRMGRAHSIEIWEENNLIGGLYGIALERIFCAESMFSLQPSASKIALVYLGRLLQEKNIDYIEVQFMTDHLRSMGAVEISRESYFEFLTTYPDAHRGQWLAQY